MKRLNFLLLFILVTLTTLAHGVEINGIYYDLIPKGKQAIVTYKGSNYSEYSDEYFGSVTIPSTITVENVEYSVVSIGERAFASCHSLTSVTIPNSVTTIGSWAFGNCSGLIQIAIGNSVKEIGSSAFCNCSGLTSIDIPNSVTSIENNAFSDCRKLTSVTIPNSVTTIGGWVFDSCTALTSITIGNSVTSIGFGAFNECTSLNSINIPNSVTSIGKKAFYRCTGLTSINIGNSVTSIGDYAFEGCSSLTSIDIPNSVTSIGIYVFRFCISLNSVNIGSSVTTIEEATFSNCTSLTSISIPISVTTIGYFAFNNCSSLTSVTIPNSVTAIRGSAFEGCSSLAAITIPNSVKTIGGSAFSSCKNLELVTCLAENVPGTHSTAFKNSYVNFSTLYVPAATIDTYKSTAPWSEFGTILPLANSSHKLTYKVNGEIYKEFDVEEGSAITPEDAPTKTGYTFSGWSEIPTTMPNHDVEINGYFTINQYTITFDTDGGSSINSITQDYGTAISIPENPTKKGYTFAGWDKPVPTTMPAENITLKAKWNINSYKLTYKVDGEIYKEFTLEYNSNVTPEENLAKTGYTFSGWSEIPSLMPDYDVIVTGSFTVNQYTITFDTDGGSTINPITQDYGSAITAPVNPSKTGYTFVGWNKDIPVTMPAENITIKAIWSINSYKLTYKVGNDIYKEISVEYGSNITPETAPEKDGYTFSGWSEIPSTMPDYDVVITGSFAINQYLVKFVADGVTIKEDRLDFGTTIVAPENPAKEGYEFKGWNPEVDNTVPSHDVTYTAVFEVASVINAIPLDAETVDVRNINGQLIKKNATRNDIQWLPTGIYIINGKKVIMK